MWLGMLLGGVAPAAAAVWLAIALPFAIGGCLRSGRAADLALMVAIALAGAGRYAAHVAVLEVQRRSVDAGSLYRIRGTIDGHPARESESPLASVIVADATPPLPRGSRLRLWLPAGTRAEWGDSVEIVARLETPGPARNPGGVDPRGIADASAVVAQGQGLAAAPHGSSRIGSWSRATVVQGRRSIERALSAGLTPEAHELIAPLVTGDRTAMSSELSASLRAAGIVHVIALSGLHVSGLAAAVRVGAAALGGGLRVRAAAGALCALLYVGIAGALPSLARAAVTESLATLARFSGRALDGVQALAVSALGLLIVAPGWSRDLGFQLSCAATAGLIGGFHAVRHLPKGRGLVHGLSGTLGAQIAAAPLLLSRLHGVAWVAPVTNLVAVPLSAMLLAAAWVAALWELALPGTGRVWFAACEALARALRYASDWGAAIPHAFVATGSGAALGWVSACSAVLMLAAALQGRTLEARRIETPLWVLGAALIGGTMLLATIISAAGMRPLAPPAETTWVVVLDVGQGDAIAIGSARGWCLVDTGPGYPRGDAGASRVLPFLRWAAVRRLSGVVLTHADRDHAGGVASVLREVPAAVAATPFPDEAARAVGGDVRWRSVLRGDTLFSCGGAVVLWPPAQDSLPERPGRNHRSLVLALRTSGGAVLLLADVDAAAETLLQVGSADLIKVAHHGSRSSTSAELLARTRPGFAAISCGARNRYGHPDAGVLARLAAAGVRVARTDREGALWFALDGRGVRRVDWRGREHRVREAKETTVRGPLPQR